MELRVHYGAVGVTTVLHCVWYVCRDTREQFPDYPALAVLGGERRDSTQQSSKLERLD